MRLTSDLEGARVNISQAAELAGMHPAHFRRLVRRGVFPKPKRTGKGRPFYDFSLLSQAAAVVKSGVGLNGEEIMFYRRRKGEAAGGRQGTRPRKAAGKDEYLSDLVEALHQLGLGDEELAPEKVAAALKAAFGGQRPELGVAFPAVAQKLIAQ